MGNMFFIYCLIYFNTVSLTQGWTLLNEIHIEETPVRIKEIDSNFVSILVRASDDDSVLYSLIELDIQGQITGKRVAENSEYPNTPSVISSIVELEADEGVFDKIICVCEDGDILWECLLDEVFEYESNVLHIYRLENNRGCIVISKSTDDFHKYIIWRILQEGEVFIKSIFTCEGGPMINFNEVQETGDSGVLITGVTDKLGMNLYMFVLRFNLEGNILWSVLEDFRFHACGSIIEQDNNGNVYIAGYTGDERDDGFFLPPANMDIVLLKLNGMGREVWRTTFRHPLQNSPILMTVLNDEKVLVLASLYKEGQLIDNNYLLLQYEP